MPKNPIDYQNTIIYKIEHIEKENLIYVGHTTNWDRRKYSHKHRCLNENNSKHNLKVYQMMRDNGGWEMFRMIEIEKYPCNDRREADKRECEVMKELRSNMNMIFSYVSEEDKRNYIESHKEERKINNCIYREKNVDFIKKKKKEYQELNKDRIFEKKKHYRELNKDKIKDKKKDYHERNIEKIHEKKRQYYQANKERIKEKSRIRYLNSKEKLKEHNQ